MAKNDYRRQLIMLRGLEKGYGGHARLEKRVLTGTMDFVTNARSADDALEAGFVGVRGGKTVYQALGAFKDSARGQKGLLASFDPRNIAGMDLGEVSAAVVSRIENGQKTPVMYACINGVCTLDWDGIKNALNSGAAPSPEKEAPPAPQIPLPETQKVSSDAEAVQSDAAPEPPENEPDAQSSDAQSPEPAKTDAAKEPKAPSAISLIDIDPSLPWPEDVESLRLLFMTKPAYTPFETDEYVFIRAKMADETGIDHCAVGVRAENGRITGVCYALPMPYTPEPPAGLEDYFWIGDETGGWWVTSDEIGS